MKLKQVLKMFSLFLPVIIYKGLGTKNLLLIMQRYIFNFRKIISVDNSNHYYVLKTNSYEESKEIIYIYKKKKKSKSESNLM